MITRFAPSPTGPLHLGHAYSAILAHDMARAVGGTFLLRIDDLDQSRSRPQWEAQIYDDLAWLGLSWDAAPTRQSDHFDLYTGAIDRLAARGLVYPCSCSRRDIAAAASAAHEGEPPMGPDGVVYPGTCRHRPMADRKPGDALRLRLQDALPAQLPSFAETGPNHAGTHQVTAPYLMTQVGDPVLSRPNLPAAYNFAVTLDDAQTQVTHVIRGEDLFEASFLQRVFHDILGLRAPVYHHHPLIRDEAGKRLAKRDDARSISTYRQDGLSPQGIRLKLGL